MPDLSNTSPIMNNPQTPGYPGPTPTTCTANGDPAPNVDDSIGLTDRYFVSLRKEAYKTVRTQEADHLVLPWGPRIDAVFDPRGAPGVLNGRVRLLGRTRGSKAFELATATITNVDQPVTLSASFACDEYVVTASAGTDPGNTRIPESYFFARVYDGRR